MIDKELEAKIQSVRANGSSDECFQMSCELLRRAEDLCDRIWSKPDRYSNWECRTARREAAHGCPLDSLAHGDYLARHKWPKYKRQFLNHKLMVMLSVMSTEMIQLGMSRLEFERGESLK